MSFAYGFGLPHWQPLSGGAFSPAQLFQGGVQGAFYDPSDPATLFVDRAGTTPCGTPGGGSVVPVGLMLDKSQNGVGTNGAKRVNLLTYTEQFDNAAWVKDSCTITANATTAPNGTLTADKVVSAAATAQTGVTQSIGTNSGQFTQSWFLKQAEVRYVQLLWSGSGSTEYANFDLQTGVVTLTTASITPTISAAANGFYRVTLTSTFASATVQAFCWAIGSGTAGRGGTYPGNGVDGFFAWGADLRLTSEAATLPLYQRIDANWYSTMAGNHAIAANDTTARPELRARVNLLTYSEDFGNAAWVKTGGTITANADTAPDGTLTADLLIGNGTTFVAVQQSSGTLGTGRASFYVKAGTETKCEIWPNLGSSLARFDLSAVTATNTGGSNAAITAVGNGWFRISVDSGAFNANVRLILGYSAPTLSTTMLIWGAQLTATNEFPANTYQRISDANTYDAVGFPRYFVANGTSSAMSTPGNVPFATVTSDGQARRNLLSNPTQFDSSGWTRTAISVAAVTDPDGTSTASKIASTSGTFQSGLVTTGNPSGGTQTISIYAKAVEAPILQIATLTFGDFQCYFNLLTGVSNGTAGFTRTMQDIGNGWWRCSVSGNLTAGGNIIFIPMAVNSGLNPAPIGDGILVWRAQLETGSTATAFQNIGTDKVTVFAGVRKLAEASYPTIVEFSVNSSVNTGSFSAYASGSSTPRYPVFLFGTASTGYEPQTYAAPISNVLAVGYDIGAADRSTEVIPRINGVVNQTNPVGAAAAGTGNFGTYPLFIGARNNASLFLNGNIYSLIVVGSAVSAGQISATEQWVAGKTGITI